MYLTLEQLRARRSVILDEIEALLSTAPLVGRPRAAQWTFLKACLAVALGDQPPSDFDPPDRVRSAQLKFEVEERLRRYYLHPGRKVTLVLHLVHVSRLERAGVAHGYPAFASYALLATDADATRWSEGGAKLRDYLERIVAEAIDDEFEAFRSLPRVRRKLLCRRFVEHGPAFRQVVTYLEGLKRRGWVISEPPTNPSTKRLMSVRVTGTDADTAHVKTEEYWYLYYWDPRRTRYVHPYRERNRQEYVLRRCEDGEWRVLDNIYPAPRTTSWARRRKPLEK